MTHRGSEPPIEKTLPSSYSGEVTNRGGKGEYGTAESRMIPLDANALAGLNSRLIAKLEVIKHTTTGLDGKLTDLIEHLKDLSEELRTRDQSVEELMQKLASVITELQVLGGRVFQLEQDVSTLRISPREGDPPE